MPTRVLLSSLISLVQTPSPPDESPPPARPARWQHRLMRDIDAREAEETSVFFHTSRRSSRADGLHKFLHGKHSQSPSPEPSYEVNAAPQAQETFPAFPASRDHEQSQANSESPRKNSWLTEDSDSMDECSVSGICLNIEAAPERSETFSMTNSEATPFCPEAVPKAPAGKPQATRWHGRTVSSLAGQGPRQETLSNVPLKSSKAVEAASSGPQVVIETARKRSSADDTGVEHNSEQGDMKRQVSRGQERLRFGRNDCNDSLPPLAGNMSQLPEQVPVKSNSPAPSRLFHFSRQISDDISSLFGSFSRGVSGCSARSQTAETNISRNGVGRVEAMDLALYVGTTAHDSFNSDEEDILDDLGFTHTHSSLRCHC